MNANQIAAMAGQEVDFSDEAEAAYWKQEMDDASEGANVMDIPYQPKQYCRFCGDCWDGDEINSMYRLEGDTWVNIYVCDECKHEHAVNGMPLMSEGDYWDMVAALSQESGLS